MKSDSKPFFTQFNSIPHKSKNKGQQKVKRLHIQKDDPSQKSENLAAGVTQKLFDLIFASQKGSLSERLLALKKLLEPTHSKFGFALSDDTSGSSKEDVQNTSTSTAGQLSSAETGFTKRVRKQLEKLLVFYADSEND